MTEGVWCWCAQGLGLILAEKCSLGTIQGSIGVHKTLDVIVSTSSCSVCMWGTTPHAFSSLWSHTLDVVLWFHIEDGYRSELRSNRDAA